MIQKLESPSFTDFEKNTLRDLAPYFDCGLTDDEHATWFENLLTLAHHNLSIAHCLQHHHSARLFMTLAFDPTNRPSFYKSGYADQIGCYSNVKSADSLALNDGKISGTKHWISNLHQADYAVLMVSVDRSLADPLEAYVLFDLTDQQHQIDSSTQLVGMEIARAGSLIVKDYCVPPNYMLGQRQFLGNKGLFIAIGSWHDYAFITNYLGCIIGLYKDLESYVNQKNINIDLDLKKLGLEIAGLKMMWSDNLHSVVESLDRDKLTDAYWHRRNTQYTKSKAVLLSLINLILQTADSRWLDRQGNQNQRFRDALVFATHMKPLYRNLQDKHFVKF